MATATTHRPRSADRHGRRRAASLWQRITPQLLPAFTVLAIIYLMIPIAVMIVFSFNEPVGKFNYNWNEFSLQGWLHPFDWPGLGDAVRTSLDGRGPVDDLRDDPGHDDRAGPDPLPVPRPRRAQRDHLPADGDARRSCSAPAC